MGLRLAEGIDLGDYEALSPGLLDRTVIAQLEDERLVTHSGNVLAATPRGRLVLNSVIAALAK
jgi:oxygen-independent coproporphyrinogen-3 oxidase